MTQLTVNPYLFVMPAMCLVIWAVTHNKTVRYVTFTSFLAASVLTVMASNPVIVSDSVTKIWHECSTAIYGGSKTCHVQFGAVPAGSSAQP